MSDIKKLTTSNGNINQTLMPFLKSLLAIKDISAILIPSHLPAQEHVMPTLIHDPENLSQIDVLSPAFALNAAKLVGHLTRKPSGQKIIAVLRSCEIRAFVELVKLKQATRQDLIIVGLDCYGAFTNADFKKFAKGHGPDATQTFFENAKSNGFTPQNDIDLANACKACEHPIPILADIYIPLFGIDVSNHLYIVAKTDAGQQIVDSLDLESGTIDASHQKACQDIIASRTQYRDEMFERTRELTHNLEKVTDYLSGCVNCYNCRVACPVCYCRECVFTTDVFMHQPVQYLAWAKRKGRLKMPTDTVFYHMTRVTHMSTACVGCGQCSNACPNDIPVMEFFRTAAHRTQNAFGYQAGRSLEEKPPLSEFKEDEFQEVVGLDTPNP